MKRDAAVAPEYSLEDAPAAAAQGTREPLPVDGMIGVRAAWKRLDNNGGIHDALRLLSEFDQRQELADSAARNASLRRGGHTPQ